MLNKKKLRKIAQQDYNTVRYHQTNRGQGFGLLSAGDGLTVPVFGSEHTDLC